MRSRDLPRAHRAQPQGPRAGRGRRREPYEGRARARRRTAQSTRWWCFPALIDGEGPILFESLAIIEYLNETHPNPPLLPRDARGRAGVRGLAQIVACDSHPLIVPRVREYLAHDFKFDEASVTKWCQHWHRAAITALETNLQDKATGRYAHGDTVTLADICLASQAAGAKYYAVDTTPFPNFARIVNELSQIDAFARAHPMKQPGAPATA